MAAQEQDGTEELGERGRQQGEVRSDDPSGLVGEGFGSPVADRVHTLLAPVVGTVGVELVDVQWSGGTLRLAVEQPGDDDGVTTDVLAQVNRLVSPLLDQHDPVPGRYTLEVSSPGVERPLRRHDHFLQAVGEVVIVKTVPGHDPRRLRGPLRSVADGELTIDVVETDGVDLAEVTPMRVALADVASARTHFDWGPTPKKGGKGSKKGPKKSGAEPVGERRAPNKAGGHGGRAKPKGQRPKQKQTNTTEEERGRT